MSLSGTMNFDEFYGDTRKTGAKYADWRDKGKIAFFIHPSSPLGKRVRVMARVPVEDDDGVKRIGSDWRFYKGKDKDPTEKFLDWLANEDSIKANDVVFRIQAGDETEEYRKGDLLNLKGFSWEKQILNPRTEYVLCIVPVESPEMLILRLPKSGGKDLARLVKGEMEEYGEEGDPWRHPWAIRLSYDQGARSSERYKATRHQAVPTEDHYAYFDQDPEDVGALCDEAVDDQQDKDMSDLIRDMLAIPCPLFGVEAVEETEEEPQRKREAKESRKPKSKPQTRAAKPPKPSKKKKTAKKAETEAEKEAEAAPTKKRASTKKTKPKQRRVAKPPPPPEPEPEPEEEDEGDELVCPECDRSIDENDNQCPWEDCGVTYVVEDEDGEEEEDGPFEDSEEGYAEEDEDVPF